MFSWLKRKKENNLQTKNESSEEKNFNDNDATILLQNIKREFGLDYEKQKYLTLRKIERFAIKNSIYNFTELQKRVENSQELQTQLLNMLTVGETYFYREMGHFKILSTFIKEKNIQKILCAPSSTGEEIYSILLYLEENAHKNITITGIDLNSEAIQRAKQGCYLQRSLSKLPQNIRNKYFHAEGQKECIQTILKQKATFLHQNIFDEKITKLGSFDAIFCRNMLIYFDHEEKVKALMQLASLLKNGGLLFIGHADISFTPHGFEKRSTPDGSYFIKST